MLNAPPVPSITPTSSDDSVFSASHWTRRMDRRNGLFRFHTRPQLDELLFIQKLRGIEPD